MEIDQLEAEDYAAGLFFPEIVDRTRFGDADLPHLAKGAHYVILVRSCHPNTFGHVVRASFRDEELALPHPKPFYRAEWHPNGLPPACAR
jgi:hypothetical protein